MSPHSSALPEPLHWFRFDTIGTRHLTDQCGPARLAVDHCVPVQGHSGPGLRFGVNAAQLVTWPMRSTLPGQPLQPALPDLPPPWTLALWIRRDSDGSNISNGGNSGGGATLLSSRLGGIKIAQWGTNACLGLTRYDHCDWACDATLPLDRWCHLGVVAQAGRTDFYIDGALAGQIAASIDLPRGWLGSSAGWAETLHASLSDLRLYPQALDGAQLRQLAAAPALAATRMRLQDGAGHRLEENAVLDFGMVTGNCMASVQVQIDNEGDAPLLLTPQLISQPTSQSARPITAITAITADAQFTLELPGSRIVPPRGRTRLIVHFKPLHPGPAQTTLTIDSNDAAAPLRTLTIAALGDVPIPLPALHVALAQTPVTPGQQRWLGRVAAGSRKVWLLSLSNRGDAPLHFTLQLDSRNGQFACWQGQGPHTVAPGGTFCADLAFSAQSGAPADMAVDLDVAATLRIVSNDPDQPDFTFQLQAGIEPAQARLQIDGALLSDAAALPLTIGAPDGTPVGQRVRQLIRLHNVGNAMAHLANAPRLLNSNDDNDDNSDNSFALDAPVLLHLAAGATLALPVTFAPASRGAKRARLQLDWDGGVAELHLLAQAT
jgi:hypothetical protein